MSRWGGKEVVVMAGPCSVESEDQITAILRKSVRKSGGQNIARRGFSSQEHRPTASRALVRWGLQFLAEARQATGMPIITEVMDTKDLDLVCEYADCLQVGASEHAKTSRCYVRLGEPSYR